MDLEFWCPADQPLLQFLPARRGQEHRDGFGQRLLDGLAPPDRLDQDRLPASSQARLPVRPASRPPLQAAVDVRPLQHLAAVDELLEAIRGDEVVVDSVDLTGTGRPGGRGDTEVKARRLI